MCLDMYVRSYQIDISILIDTPQCRKLRFVFRPPPSPPVLERQMAKKFGCFQCGGGLEYIQHNLSSRGRRQGGARCPEV
jgi:hypothetical protein